MFRDFSQAVCEVFVSRLSALALGFQHLSSPSWPALRTQSCAIPRLSSSVLFETICGCGYGETRTSNTAFKLLRRTRSVGGHGLGQSLAQTRMKQHKVMIDLAQRQWLVQSVVALPRGSATPLSCRSPLTQAQIEPCDKHRLNPPAAGGQALIARRCCAEYHLVFDLDDLLSFPGLDHLHVENLGKRPPARLGRWASGWHREAGAPRNRNESRWR